MRSPSAQSTKQLKYFANTIIYYSLKQKDSTKNFVCNAAKNNARTVERFTFDTEPHSGYDANGNQRTGATHVYGSCSTKILEIIGKLIVTNNDNEAFSYNGDFSYHLVRYPHIIYDVSALDNMRYDALFGMGSNRFGTMAVDYTSSSTSRSGCLNIEIVICLSEFIRSGYTGLHTHANTAVAMRRLRRSER